MGLAGAKKKQRISVDPQNVAWKSDTSKFGYKMLMKMGWQEGKGLGKDEDGTTDHLSVQFKADTIGILSLGNLLSEKFKLGLGVTKKDAAQETYQQLTAFDDILRRISPPEADSTDEADTLQGPVKEGKKARSKGGEHKDCDSTRDRKRKRKHDEKPAHPSKDSPEDSMVSSRLAHRRKFIKNKRVDQYSAEHLKAILGIPFPQVR